HLVSVPCYNGTILILDYLTKNFPFFALRFPDDDPVYSLRPETDTSKRRRQSGKNPEPRESLIF
ncbi:MAG: hypothetical protein ACLTXL_17060, partial [Clostridia bacterium]